VRRFAPLPAIAFSLALLFPLNFVMIAILGRFGEFVQVRFALMGLFTFISFVVIPWLIARHQRVNATSGFGLAMPRAVFLLGAVILGVSLWPIVMSMISLWHDLYATIAGAESTEQWRERLVELSSEQVEIIRTLPPLSILIAFSVIPAICEEWFFRGFLLRGLLNRMSRWRAIIISAVLFGLFHTLSGSVVAFDRLIPTIAIGIILGYVCYKSNSIVPGVVLHMLHNGIVVFLAYYEPQLRQFDWFPSDGEVPYSWMFVALVPAVIGMFVVARPAHTPMVKE
ncbi:MAG: type II CAAX endopeptidase family protein, partial [Planctomycetota bacterium]